MASGNLKNIKGRIKSVNSTMKITKAMELVASSKLKKAKSKLENNKAYFETIYNTMTSISKNNKDFSSIYLRDSRFKNYVYIVIAGDRGLAGGYNSNILKLAASNINKEEDKVIAFGNKSIDYFKRNNYDVIYSSQSAADELFLPSLFGVSNVIIDLFKNGKVGNVYIMYTDFLSSLTQEPMMKKILPINFKNQESNNVSELISYEPSIEGVFDNIIPNYISGIIYSALVDSYAAEQGARRNAMESANDNAKEIINKLDLLYNRARQGAITQEITEIVGGSEALN